MFREDINCCFRWVSGFSFILQAFILKRFMINLLI